MNKVSKNPLSYLKPTNMLKLFTSAAACAAAARTAPSMSISDSYGLAPALAPKTAPAPTKAALVDPTLMCYYAKADTCRLRAASSVCTDKTQGQGSFGLVEEALAEPYGGSPRPAMLPKSTYAATCEAVSEQLDTLEATCLPKDLSGPC